MLVGDDRLWRNKEGFRPSEVSTQNNTGFPLLSPPMAKVVQLRRLERSELLSWALRLAGTTARYGLVVRSYSFSGLLILFEEEKMVEVRTTRSSVN